MKTVGEILSQVRKEKELTLDQVARKTKIRPKFIKAIEKDELGQLPSATVAQGFIKNYAEFIGASTTYVLALFRRDFVTDESGRIIPRHLAEPLVKKTFWQSPHFGYFLAGIGLVLLLGVYLFFQYFTFWNGPRLEVDFSGESITTRASFFEVSGCTEPEAVVRINNQLISLDDKGCFRQGVNLTLGENALSVVAENKIGRRQVRGLTVFREED